MAIGGEQVGEFQVSPTDTLALWIESLVWLYNNQNDNYTNIVIITNKNIIIIITTTIITIKMD